MMHPCQCVMAVCGMKIFLVEDSKAVRQRVAGVLGCIPGVEIEEAATLAEAKERLLKNRPDVAVLDIQLPDGRGMDLLKYIKGRLPGTRNIVFTNHPHYRQHCLLNGADYFFDKSIELDDLIEVVGMLAEREKDGNG
jgi:two-component system, OmpR family, response regulator